jgi:hypothetical protein
MSSPSNPKERRRARRRPVLETFSLFVVIPKKGIHRLAIHDVSDLGIGFDLDTEGESPADFPLTSGNSLDLRLYLNQSLYLPLTVEVVRIEDRNTVRRVGAEFAQRDSGNYKGFLAFLTMLDSVIDVVRIEEQPAG